MPMRETLRKNLTPELFAQVMDALGDDFEFDLVPRSRLNKVIKQRNALREQLEEGSQPSAIDDDDSGDKVADDFSNVNTKQKSKAVQRDNSNDVKALEKRHKEEMTSLAIRYSALDKLRAAGAKNPELILKAGLLDIKGAKVSEDGEVTWPEGDADPFVTLKGNKEYEYLFNQIKSTEGADDEDKKDTDTQKGTGKDSGNSGTGGAELDARLDQAMGLASGITEVE